MCYKNDRHVDYMMGFEDALNNVAKVIMNRCGKEGCPFEKDCEAFTEEECLGRIINCFNEEFKKK